MSYLNGLLIQGVRSFGPEESDKQKIKFFTPLTLILGPNGTGKTTIIECLRYITTGDQPPQCKGGFFHDPKLVSLSEVKAQVKLSFFDVEGKQTVAIRNTLTQQKKSKITTKTLDSVILKTLPNGEKASISQKCAQIDKEMINSLGVSKAILTDVIFCHQEESNWPLNESKAVKEKFDDIFAATRYIKAIEEIGKIRKQKAIEIREYQVEIKHVRANKDKSIQFASELREAEAKYAASKEKIKEAEDELKPLTAKLTHCGEIEHQLNKLKSDEAKQETLLQQLFKNKEDLLKCIQDVFPGTEQELKLEIKNFQGECNRKKFQLDDEKKKGKRIEQECKVIRNKKSTTMMDLGKLKTIEQQHKEHISSRNSFINKVAIDLKMDEFTHEATFNEAKVTEFLNHIVKLTQESQVEHDTIKKTYETEEGSLKQQMEAFHNKEMKFEQVMQINKDRLKSNKNEIENIDRDLRKVDDSVVIQKKLESALARLEIEKTELEGSIDINALKAKISELNRDRDTLGKELGDLSNELTRIHTEGKKRTELDLLESSKSAKEGEIRKITSRHEDMILHLLGRIPDKNIIRELETANSKLQKEIKADTKVLNDMKNKLSSLDTARNFQMEQLKKKEETLQGYEEKIFQVGGSTNFDDTLNSTQTNLQTVQDEKGALIGSQFIYSKYIEKLEETKPCCPLCQRGFVEEDESQDLLIHLQRKIAMIPEQVEGKERQIADLQKKLNSVLELRPLQEEIRKLKVEEVPEIKSQLSKFNSEIEETRHKITESEDNIDMKQVDHKSFSSIQPDMISVNQLQQEVQKLEKQISSVKARLGGNVGQSRSMEEVNSERAEKDQKLAFTNKSVQNLQDKVCGHTNELHSLIENINGKKGELLKIAGEQQKKQSLEEQKTKLALENQDLLTSIEKLQQEVNTVKNNWQQLKTKKDKVAETKESKLSVLLEKLENLHMYKRDLSSYTRDINNYLENRQDEKIKDCNRKVDHLTTELLQKENDFQSSISNAEKLQRDISNQEVKFRDLEDNLKLKVCERELLMKQSDFEETKVKIGNFGEENLFLEKRKLSERYNKLDREKQQLEGRLRGQGEMVRKLRKELEDEQFKDADKKYRDKLIQLKLSELCTSDLKKYSQALDKVVMEFHKLKMAEVNKIIKQLWRKTYSGRDINYIEIATEETEQKEGRRTYNYKVVMYMHHSGTTPLEMRGRCSAGQKVLASLIIRLALAETFCLNCGILALDEPTTNLDNENMVCLAHALIQIVNSRSLQKNFQLIVITHDEEFISLLSRSNIVDYFYKVSKDDRGYSNLAKCMISQIN